MNIWQRSGPIPYLLKSKSYNPLRKLGLPAIVTFSILGTACTTASQPIVEDLKPGNSVFSDYLIGQFAVRHRHMDDASRFLESVHDEQGLPETLSLNLDRQLFTVLAGEGEIDRAAEIAETMTDEELMAQLVLIVRDVKNGNDEGAILRAQNMSSSGLGSFVKPMVQAWALVNPQDLEPAIKALEPLSEQQGLETLFNMQMALLYEVAGQTEKVEEFYKKASNGSNGMSLRLAELYGAFLVSQNRPQDATAVFSQYFEDNPESLYIQAMLEELETGKLETRGKITKNEGLSETLFGLASSLRSRNTRQAGLIMGQLALYLTPDFPIGKILIAEILESDQRFDAANKIYAQVSKNDPFVWPADLRRAINLDELERPDDAVALLRDMINRKPERLEAQVALGDILRHRERYAEADKVYERAIDLIGEDPPAHHWNIFYSRGIALERLKRWEQAEPFFLKALELEPKQPFVLNYLGYTWVEIGRNMEEALEMIEEAVSQRPRDGYIVDSLGWALYKMGDYEQAVTYLERAVELQPSDPVINDHLGDAYWKVGRNREARFQWSRAKNLDPEPDVLEIIVQKLEKGLLVTSE